MHAPVVAPAVQFVVGTLLADGAEMSGVFFPEILSVLISSGKIILSGQVSNQYRQLDLWAVSSKGRLSSYNNNLL